ncbi:hypothetical protein SAMN00120144_0509 [Hymenobacter roseosalivarius DSM 11622]|uniref:Uncharacterized protein n=1 Tax=Hymenobacter roseosalivarius DSM 11622 TaxID=645990 RepID=A0A1W1VRF5_9BACT|nr:hypothetical protein SAMN00120144_0509 [Hymenobacter roseosalivarius DSM 11622]
MFAFRRNPAVAEKLQGRLVIDVQSARNGRVNSKIGVVRSALLTKTGQNRQQRKQYEKQTGNIFQAKQNVKLATQTKGFGESWQFAFTY